MRSIPLLSALSLAFAASAQAGFQFEATPSAPQPVVGATPGFPSPYAHPQALPVAHPAPDKPVAIGEGSNVPLRSAVLDILPQDIHPSYTDAVNPDVIISWHGGRPWDVVLREAVKPLGILVAVKGNDVTLSR